jgi:PAS domain S-box-containing protein
VLGSYRLMDSDGTSAVNSLVRTASRLCGVSVAMVGLLDDHRQWLLSVIGLPDAREVARELTVCTHTIGQDAIVVVEDLAEDPRFRDLPMVKEGARIRFYAGVPLINPEGFALGALCVADREPRRLDDSQVAALEDIAVAVGELLEARRSEHELQRALGVVRTLATEREQARLRTEGQNELLRLAEEVSEVGHWRADLVSQRTFWSPQVYRLHGHDPASHTPDLESAIMDYHPDDRDAVRQALALAVGEHRPFNFDLRIVRADGEIRRVHCRGLDEIDAVTGESVALFGVLQDVTDRERVRELSERRDRLVTTGTLAAGIGHEINNPLTFITTNLDFALEELLREGGDARSSREEIVEVLHEARAGADRIRTIVRGLRAFAREETVPVSTDVHSTLEVSVNVAMHELRHRATLVKLYAPVPRVLADDARLSQVLVNLLTNAAHSFATHDPTRNRVHLSTTVGADGRVVIEVRDNGVGIPADILPRIFDPFFTTKPAGEGTGLGLSISHNVVGALGGELLCSTVVGEGTTFRVVLPAAAGDGASPASRRSPVPGEPVRGRVLLVDDEEAVLRVVARTLGGEHEVVAVADPRLAAARLLGAKEHFDVVVCDLIMPHLSGMDLYRRALLERPELAPRFLFLSAGGTQPEVAGFLAEVSNERIDKPFDTRELRSLVRHLVEIAQGERPAES